MKTLTVTMLMSVVILCSSFKNVNPSVEKSIYPELDQSFKQLKKNVASIPNDQQDALEGVQQLGIVTKGKKQPVIIEFMSKDGFSAQYAKAVLTAALAANDISDVKVLTVGSEASAKLEPALTKLGFKVTSTGGLTAKYNDQASVTFENSVSNPQVIHVLLSEDSKDLLSSPDKFAVKLKYPNLNGATDEQYQQQAKTIATEMLFVVAKIKGNWKI